MRLCDFQVQVGACGTIPETEQRVVGEWLHQRLHHYQGELTTSALIPGQKAVTKLLQSGLSELKRRYRGKPASAHSVAWAWLGHEYCAGRLQPSVVRYKQGGREQSEWAWSAMLDGGWISKDAHNREKKRHEYIFLTLPRCAGVFLVGHCWYFEHQAMASLYQMLRRHYPARRSGVDLLTYDILSLGKQEKVCGDILRLKPGGSVDFAWWDRVKSVISNFSNADYSQLSEIEAYVTLLYDSASHRLSSPSSVDKPISYRTFWVLDLCCGFRSLDLPVAEVLKELAVAGDEIRCVGLDACAHQIMGERVGIPDFCGDLLDDQTLPPLYIVESLSVYLGLSMQYLVHVHASPPCLTNSRADASNVNRGCGYRDWHSPFCIIKAFACQQLRPYSSVSH